ncbi:MAG: hypothetical protein ACTSPA_10080, partial [Promethearchaeota archaeon]
FLHILLLKQQLSYLNLKGYLILFLFKFLLKLRNSINNFLLLTIGSTDFGDIFNEKFFHTIKKIKIEKLLV